MNWVALITNIINHVPIERALFHPRDNTKALEEFITSMGQTRSSKEAPISEKPTSIITRPPGDVATACVPCALGHFSTSAGLLNEAVRFKGEGITSNEIIDRVAKVLEEQNTLERVDLAPEKIRSSPEWERDIAEESLEQSRSLRHRLETIETIDDLELAAADTAAYYRKLNREWWQRRFAHLGDTPMRQRAQELANRVHAGKLSRSEAVAMLADDLAEEETR